MRIATFVFCILFSVLCSATAKTAVTKAQDAVRNMMKDPSSVQFRNVRYVPDQHVVCGRYNAKNSYGAYTGFHFFAVDSHGSVHQIREPPSDFEMTRMTVKQRNDFIDSIPAIKADNAMLLTWCLASEPKS